jgi:FKBP-type peptidyl-prolyl cis-trans isomerase SlyD
MAQHYLKVSYRMFTNSAASHKLLYETEVTKPVAFVTDMGLMIDAFEERLTQLHPGESFDFTLQPAEAFGERDEDLVRAVPKKIFEVRGRFIEEEVYPGAEVPLMDNEGNHFQGTIVQVTDKEVTVDLNNPLAGREIQFTGRVLENREATLKEIEQTAKILAGECGCGGDCGGCGGSEGCGGCGGGGCGGCQ